MPRSAYGEQVAPPCCNRGVDGPGPSLQLLQCNDPPAHEACLARRYAKPHNRRSAATDATVGLLEARHSGCNDDRQDRHPVGRFDPPGTHANEKRCNRSSALQAVMKYASLAAGWGRGPTREPGKGGGGPGRSIPLMRHELTSPSEHSLRSTTAGSAPSGGWGDLADELTSRGEPPVMRNQKRRPISDTRPFQATFEGRRRPLLVGKLAQQLACKRSGQA